MYLEERNLGIGDGNGVNLVHVDKVQGSRCDDVCGLDVDHRQGGLTSLTAS